MSHSAKSNVLVRRSLLLAVALVLSACSSGGIIAPDDDYIVISDELQEGRPTQLVRN
ncbi:MAG TPA: hypothetical protein VK864_04345 [Longimicrobiales bacterium]|nr:hypothetical protein [Longimicrobiales bacterium]